eukprot:XP_011678405.1 PREDICTED: neurogenic locus notch homolog protein 1-like [Strongylocentrotus purpuratus]
MLDSRFQYFSSFEIFFTIINLSSAGFYRIIRISFPSVKMDKDLIRGVVLVFLTCVSFASLVSSNEYTGTCYSDGLGLNYTLPMFNECKKELHYNGSMVQTIPKLISYTSNEEAACPRRKSKLGIPPGHRVCRLPDCGENPCRNGWCEETMTNFKCHCSAGYRGKRCDERENTKQS